MKTEKTGKGEPERDWIEMYYKIDIKCDWF